MYGLFYQEFFFPFRRASILLLLILTVITVMLIIAMSRSAGEAFDSKLSM
jgi:hypothetical protein